MTNENLIDINPTLNLLIDIELSGDKNERSFYVRRNFKELSKEFPYLHDTIGVEASICKILKESESENLLKLSLSKIKNAKNRYFVRNIAMILSEYYLSTKNLSGIQNVVDNYLEDEFKFLGQRQILAYYAENYNPDGFFRTLDKIERKNSLTPTDRNTINLFIENFTSTNLDLEETKKMVKKHKLWNKIEDYIRPMLVGYFKNKDVSEFHLIGDMVFAELEDDYSRYFAIEDIYYELYSKIDESEKKIKTLNSLKIFVEGIPKELKVKGHPGKLWTLCYWRLGCKYMELDVKQEVSGIIKLLTGKNKESLQELFRQKYSE